jgi:hypothetical protein
MIQIDTLNQYITPELTAGGFDTGVVPTNNTVIKFIGTFFSGQSQPVVGTNKFQFYINSWNGNSDPGSNNYYGIKTFGNTITKVYSNGLQYKDNYFIVIQSGIQYEITFGNGFLKVFDITNNKTIVDETLSDILTDTDTQTIKIRPYIHEASYLTLFRLQIFESGTLIKDFVPCHDDNDINGLYDLIQKNIIYPVSGSWTGATPYYRGTLIKTDSLAECYFNNNEVKTLKFNGVTVWQKQEDVVQYITAVKSNAGAYCIIPYVPKFKTKTRFKCDGWKAESMVYGCRYGGRNCEFNICATGTSDGKAFRFGLGSSYSRTSGTSSQAKDYTWTADSSMDSNTQQMYIFAVNTNDAPIGNRYTGNVYLIQIWDSQNNLIWDLRPALVNNVPCFVNDVDGTRIYPVTGNLIAVT